ncbi:hypothetical protein BABINDRAFT_164234 [Babjeviella inositovora NRRL Y-12698]|uniref:Tr-type G domain-containing protein n=1 Tax=Babjeviella inositovora NRRL Y-12698 TaxID=984486 RepID=A0A1E3QZD5_9ASCO|nr:uncharacterized protein BABINDRAFT_164234 [Babjeviella inositovora NRRL Y-12698]ODQ82442.1 hypothetical protein BABINDRAFT_164234 [Babjeviella inositovora NRRL Y-12698]
MDNEDLYDEFGNLIGDPLDSDAESHYSSDDNRSQGIPAGNEDAMDVDEHTPETASQAIVLHEDKKHYSTLSETFGADVETIVQTYDNQSISEPIVHPHIEKSFKVEEKSLPRVAYPRDYLLSVLNTAPHRVRNVALVGNLNSGKTTFLDMLILQTHKELQLSTCLKNFKSLRYTDNHTLEIGRGMTLKVSPVTLLLPNLKGNSLCVNLLDTPGHVNFYDELAVAQRTVDVCVVVIDLVEGLTVGTKVAIENALKNNLELKLILNKIDRLVLELKLPPSDAYFKIKYIVEQINEFIADSLRSSPQSQYPFPVRLSPELNNVCFASSTLEFCFTLKSFIKLYLEKFDPQGTKINIDEFAARLWGDIYYDPSTNNFTTKNNSSLSLTRSFIYFILTPLYKLFTHAIVINKDSLSRILYSNFNVTLPNATYKLDSQILLKQVMKAVFGESLGFGDMLQASISPLETNSQRVQSQLGLESDGGPTSPLIAHLTKLVETSDGESFFGLVRIYSGALKLNSKIKILGENFEEDDEDFHVITVDELYLSGGRYRVPVDELGPGAIGLIGNESLHTLVSKSATIYDDTMSIPHKNFPLIDYIVEPVFKVAIEPAIPSELPKLLSGLRSINKSYPGVEIKVEENGEHVIFGSGELYMDCLLHDLRQSFTGIEVKISDPITRFSECCETISFTKISVESTNGKNRISVVAEPLDNPKLVKAIENGQINLLRGSSRALVKMLRQEYGLDSLTARSIWSLGPDERNSPNLLQDDTLPLDNPDEKARLVSMKDSIKQGFKWATREGPLCDEPIRNTKFRIIDCALSDDLMSRSTSQIIPMLRKACYTAFMTASPRLLEPIYAIHVTCTRAAIKVVGQLVEKRRGSVLKDSPIPGTQLYNVYGNVPVIDSIGLESDIRLATGGQAIALLVFEKWSVVPGDPMDKTCFIPQLRPAPYKSLARDFVTKTRKRKGLTGEPGLEKYVERGLVEKLKESGLIQ